MKIDKAKLTSEQLKAREIVDEALKVTGYSPSKLALEAGIAKTTLTRFLKNPGSKTLTLPILSKIQKAAGIEPVEPVKVEVMGTVQAGNFVEASQLRPSERKTLRIMPFKGSLAKIPLYALQVAGESMNRITPNGSYVICARFYDLQTEPKDGNIVVVHRRRHDLVEATCKILKIDEDGRPWLHPYSTATDHQDPIDYLADHGVDEVEIVSLVLMKVEDFSSHL
ncbi:LexA family protein [Sneathiella glossodoripedis]|uniref:LexA family protein n=1 Tax=Sneathiella glossodoripedis TaxID=418853 RepID=UPI00131F12E1|nr:XRE family transcriptional regulator [Sneathiella glossodoripedis]